MDKINFVIITVVKLVITLLMLAIALDTAIVPLMVSTSQKLVYVNWFYINRIFAFILLAIFLHGMFKLKKAKDVSYQEPKFLQADLLLKVAYFYDTETLEEAVKEANVAGIAVNFTGTGKETLGNEEHPFALFCDEKSIGTKFFMQNGALKCAHFCTGAMA